MSPRRWVKIFGCDARGNLDVWEASVNKFLGACSANCKETPAVAWLKSDYRLIAIVSYIHFQELD
ncbi:hypothetical protein A2797_00650 [candidate division WWE3 bacterium RIFCSPHIGHO2_01_FULL_48_15]|uniref:Uncharacterized protein n=1 Tax=candidate division WWE3 bacterium RIFCSPHIGHO2_01_FULL_48_15 TaxID=1802619 RepID=A0A1F4VBM0_UNCKA|nr:MAG: hypothetical protein A2797_00650 [candidate division WWE3 bacterium RIFCSPHIGHO2_01_FULL_48_15]